MFMWLRVLVCHSIFVLSIIRKSLKLKTMLKTKINLVILFSLLFITAQAQDFVQIKCKWQKDGKTDYKYCDYNC